MNNESYFSDDIIKIIIKIYELANSIINKKIISCPIHCCLINYEWIEKFKNNYNYEKISQEINKHTKSNKYYDFNNNIEFLINKIKEKKLNIRKGESIIDVIHGISFNPKEEEFSEGLKHYTNFFIIESKIFFEIKKLNSKNEPKKLEFPFYFNSKVFYKGTNFIDFGHIEDKGKFISEYYFNFTKTKFIIKLIEKLNSNLNKFFEEKKISKNNPEKQPLIEDNIQVGDLIILKFCSPKEVLNEYKRDKKKKIDIKSQIYTKKNVFKNCIDSQEHNKRGKKEEKKEVKKEEKKEVKKEIKKEEKQLYNNINCFKNIKITPMIGLENIGQTCYMNAALQCFSNSYALVDYFLDSNKISLIENAVRMKNQDEPQLTSEFQELISNLWIKKSKNYYSPHNFKTTVGKIEPLFKNFEANDAKDFVNFIIMTLHKELNGIDNSFTNTNYIEPPTQNINQYNNVQVLQAYLYYFQLDNSSIISTYFYGTTQGEIECQNCKMQLFQMGQNIPIIKYNYQTYFFLNFPLDEVRKFIMSNQILYQNYMANGIDPNKEVNLNECFLYNQKDDYMFGYCERCDNNNAQLLSRTKLFTIPLYLIILLNRGRGIEFNIKINFPETFNSNGMAINSNGNYILYGVVKHFGDNSSSGHFAAYCRSPVDNCWYFYNDAIVTPVSEQEKAVIQNNGLTYILFYKKI